MSFRATLADLCRCAPANVTAHENDSNPRRDTLVRAARVSREARNGKRKKKKACLPPSVSKAARRLKVKHVGVTPNIRVEHLTEGQRAAAGPRRGGGGAQDGTPI